MESPVSAFSVYTANKIRKQENRKKPKQHFNDNFQQKVAQKLKEKVKKKELKNKKSHKKKKSKVSKKQNLNKILVSPINEETCSPPTSEEIPTLIPSQVLNDFDDNNDSHSSIESIEFMPVHTDSCEEGHKALKWMIAPYSPDEFLNKIWEHKPLHIHRKKPLYYKEIISTPIIDQVLRNENIQFTKNIDITSYTNGTRETHNSEGRAYPHLVWDFYLNGCSVRMLNPQTYVPKLHLLNATLQEFFNSFVGANAYLTPPDSQGFAPHYDDIEAFILQIEGKKHWRLYKPLNEKEILPRISSKNFNQDEIGEPILEVTLEAGDMLYFPRGFIHQGVTIDGEHSLHITISMYQKHSWADLLEKLVPAALQEAIQENVELRRGLPFDLYDNFGLVNSDLRTPRRKEIIAVIRSLVDKIKDHLPFDKAVDELNKNYQHDALPPVLTDCEKAVTIFGDTDVMIENGEVINRVEIDLDTKIRLLRKNILRMISEDGYIRLYYYVENSLEYHGNELPYIEIEPELAPAIETLIVAYPEYVAVEKLNAQNDIDKIQIAEALWGRGLVMTEYPLQNIE